MNISPDKMPYTNGIIDGLMLAAEICDQNTKGRKSIQAERIRAAMMKFKLKTEKEKSDD